MFKRMIKRLFSAKLVKVICPHCGHINVMIKDGIFKFFLTRERCWNCRLWIYF